MSQRRIALLKGLPSGDDLPKELTEAFEQSGFHDVETAQKSASVAFTSPDEGIELEENVRKILKEKFRVRKRPVLLGASSFLRAAEENPFPAVADSTPDNVHVFFLRKQSVSPNFQQIERFKASDEQWCLLDDALYFVTPGEFRRSKLAVRLERLLGVTTAIRTWTEVKDILTLQRIE